MKLKSLAILLMAYAISMVSCISPDQEILEDDEQPWKVGDCILAHFEMNITIHLDANKTTTIKIPKTAKVDNKSSNCGNITKNEDQRLVLNWKDADLNRELVINFRRNLTNNFYGVERFYGNFIVAQWKINTTQYNTTIEVDSKEVPNILFHTPLDRSFSCGSWGSTKLQSRNHTKPLPPTPSTLPDATVHTSMLKFDAFRNDPDRKPTQPGFRDSKDCKGPKPQDVLPFAVGCGLVGLVVVSLIAFCIRQRVFKRPVSPYTYYQNRS